MEHKRWFMIRILLIVILILLLVGAFPRWNYNLEWGYAPFGIVGTVVIILLILWLLGII